MKKSVTNHWELIFHRTGSLLALNKKQANGTSLGP